MVEWVIVVWLSGCSWSCDTTEQPTFPSYETQKDCEYALNEYLKPMKNWRGSINFGPTWYRRGRCEERVIDD
jgi:hypothetical protein